jgi:formylglycine-generating enzyme required for sulfatase activity
MAHSRHSRSSCAILFLLAGVAALWPAQSAASGNPVDVGLSATEAAFEEFGIDLPLPLLNWTPGQWLVTVKPAIFSVTPNSYFQSQEFGQPVSGSMSGYGGGIGATYAFDKKWAVYGLIEGSAMRSSGFTVGSVGMADWWNYLQLSDINSQEDMVGASLLYKFFGSRPNGFSLPVYFGPTLTDLRTTQHVSGWSSAPGTPFSFDEHVSAVMPGMMFGALAGIPLPKSFVLSPYIGGQFVVWHPRASGPGASQDGIPITLTNVQGTISNGGMFSHASIMPGQLAAGLNLVYTPWGISVNLSGILADQLIARLTGFNATSYSISYSFGKYDKQKIRIPLRKAQASDKDQTLAPPAKTQAGKAGIEWVTIPGGSFMMGSNEGLDNEKPRHRVTVKPFQMAKTLVTNNQYQACVQAGACTAPADYGDVLKGDDQPVLGVDWNQAKAFSEWAGGRLPSEAEWEYTARSAGKEQKYPWGDAEATCEKAVISSGGDGCGRNATWPVCSKPAGNTQQGLCDMAGNAWEWTQDWYHDSYNGAPTDGSAWEIPRGSLRVYRGGSANYLSDHARSSYRNANEPNARGIGFRPVRREP